MPPNPNRPRSIVITGVSRGLGRAMTAGFAAGGHVVHGCARSADAVAQLRREFPAPCTFEVVDVADENAVRSWAEKLRAAGCEACDLLLNNAALMNRPAPLWETPPEELAALFQVNVLGTVHVLRQFVPRMVARNRGVVVNFSSGWGRSVSAEVAPYCATKWAIEGLTLALAEELPDGMAAVPLNPGIIDTDMLRICFGASAGSYPKAEAWARRAVPFLLSLGPTHNGQSLTVPG